MRQNNKLTEEQILTGIIITYPEFLNEWEKIKECMPKNKLCYEMGMKIEENDMFIATLAYATAKNKKVTN